MIREEVKRQGCIERELGERAKSDPAKLAVAAHLRRETTLAAPWTAARLQTGAWTSLNPKLYRWRRANETPKPIAQTMS
jgi:hypothetical protein